MSDDLDQLVEKFSKISGQATMRVVIVPNHDDCTVQTAFGDYHTFGGDVAGLAGDDLLKNMNDAFRADDARLARDVSASKALEGFGGGGFDHGMNICFVAKGGNTGKGFGFDESVAHETGHAHQAARGYTESTTNRILLEYHNVLRYQNVWMSTEPGYRVRTHYANTGALTAQIKELFRKGTGTAGDPSMTTLRTYLAGGNDDLILSKDLDALDDIVGILGSEYGAERDTIEKNLLYEYVTAWAKGFSERRRDRQAAGPGGDAWREARGADGMPALGRIPRKDPITVYVYDPIDIDAFVTDEFRASMEKAVRSMLGDGPARLVATTQYFVTPGTPMPAGYEDIPAKTVGQQVYLNHEARDYFIFEGNGEDTGRAVLDRDKVIGTLIHETFHAVSDKPTSGAPSGLQGLLDDQLFGSTEAPLSVDEAVTDLMAMAAFKEICPGKEYPTGYAVNPKSPMPGVGGQVKPWLPSMWTGQLVDLLGELDITFDKLTEAYVSEDPATFADLRKQLVDLKDSKALETKFDAKRAVQAYTVHGVLERDNVAKVYQLLKEQGTPPAELIEDMKLAGLGPSAAGRIDREAAEWRTTEDVAAAAGHRGTAEVAKAQQRQAAAAAARLAARAGAPLLPGGPPPPGGPPGPPPPPGTPPPPPPRIPVPPGGPPAGAVPVAIGSLAAVLAGTGTGTP